MHGVCSTGITIQHIYDCISKSPTSYTRSCVKITIHHVNGHVSKLPYIKITIHQNYHTSKLPYIKITIHQKYHTHHHTSCTRSRPTLSVLLCVNYTVCRAGQNRVYLPYMTVCLMKSLPRKLCLVTPYIYMHCI